MNDKVSKFQEDIKLNQQGFDKTNTYLIFIIIYIYIFTRYKILYILYEIVFLQ